MTDSVARQHVRSSDDTAAMLLLPPPSLLLLLLLRSDIGDAHR